MSSVQKHNNHHKSSATCKKKQHYGKDKSKTAAPVMAHFNMNATVSIWLSLKLKLNRLFALSPHTHTLLCAQFERSWIKYIYARSIHQNKENGNNKRKVVIFHFTNYFIISISRLHFIVAVFLINSKTLRFCDAEKLDRKKCPSISMRAWRIFRALCKHLSQTMNVFTSLWFKHFDENILSI